MRRVVARARPVDVTIAVARGVPVDAEAAANKVRFVLEHLAGLYGPYPWPSFTLAYGPDLAARASSTRPRVQGARSPRLDPAHETAHQWFYSLVGNNQARDPWLDEGLASWAGGETSNDMAIFATVPIPERPAAAWARR